MGKIIETVTVPREITQLKDILCDSCGKSCHNGYNYAYAKMTAKWPYGSDKDLENHEVYLCEPCYDKVVKTFNIQVRSEDYLAGE